MEVVNLFFHFHRPEPLQLPPPQLLLPVSAALPCPSATKHLHLLRCRVNQGQKGCAVFGPTSLIRKALSVPSMTVDALDRDAKT